MRAGQLEQPLQAATDGERWSEHTRNEGSQDKGRAAKSVDRNRTLKEEEREKKRYAVTRKQEEEKGTQTSGVNKAVMMMLMSRSEVISPGEFAAVSL